MGIASVFSFVVVVVVAAALSTVVLTEAFVAVLMLRG